MEHAATRALRVGVGVVMIAVATATPVRAGCSFSKGLACFPVLSSCAFTAGFAGRDPYIQCVDTLSNRWCTECVIDRNGLDPRSVVCPNGGGLADKLTDCPGYGRQYLSSQMAYSGRTVAPNQDGRLEAAFTDAAGRTSHVWQEAPSGAWTTAWAPFPGEVLTASFPAIARHLDGRLDVFVVTTSGTVAHSRQVAANVNWGAWQDIGGSLRADGLAVEFDLSGRLFVVALGKDGAVWQNRRNDDASFSGWTSLGGTFMGAPALARNADGRLEVFAVAADGALLHAWQSPGSDVFGAWVAMGRGPYVGRPATARNLDQRLEVFVSTSTGALAHAWQTAPNGGWSAFDQPPGTHAHHPAIAMNVDGTLDVFVVGVADRAVWHRRQSAPNTGWGDWTSLGGVVASAPAIARNADGTLEVLAVGQDGAIWRTRQASPAGADWTPWVRVGGQAAPGLF